MLFPSIAIAWGERGHDLVTRVAVKKLAEMSGHSAQFTQPFALRNHMLSHLSNVPDFHWRADYMSENDRDLNYPTHFIGLDSIYPDAKELTDIDQDINVFYTKARDAGFENPAKIGTAPWRVVQLQQQMAVALKAAKAAESEQQKVDAINQALLYAGIMSHFVGDLANPHHTSTNYDGQLTGNTGLHAYFESDVVRELPMQLAGKVEKKAGHSLMRKTLLKPYSKAQRNNILTNPSELIFALVLDSHTRVDQLHTLDDKYSILDRSTDAKTRARRKPPTVVMHKYQAFTVERLALGASVLAQLWYLAWQQAGQPDLSSFQSYKYYLAPDFILPSYLPN